MEPLSLFVEYSIPGEPRNSCRLWREWGNCGENFSLWWWAWHDFQTTKARKQYSISHGTIYIYKKKYIYIYPNLCFFLTKSCPPPILHSHTPHQNSWGGANLHDAIPRGMINVNYSQPAEVTARQILSSMPDNLNRGTFDHTLRFIGFTGSLTLSSPNTSPPIRQPPTRALRGKVTTMGNRDRNHADADEGVFSRWGFESRFFRIDSKLQATIIGKLYSIESVKLYCTPVDGRFASFM